MSESSAWTYVANFLGGTVKESVAEIYRLIPDSILFGSILLYFLTQNVAFGVFGIFIIEIVLSHRMVSWLFTQSVGPSRSPDRITCLSGFKTPQWKVNRIFNHDNYPSYGVFSLTSIGTYLLLATNEFSDTLQAMGPEWASRKIVAYSLTAFMLISFILVRWYVGCESLGEIVYAGLIAILVGAILFFVNKQLFGVEGMNFLGLPYLVSKESQGSPIYVCAAEKVESQ